MTKSEFRFDKARILILGDIMLDRYWYGSTSRISAEAPVPVVRVRNNEERPGGAANVALNIASLGAAADLIGVTGDDEAADTLEKQLQGAGVRCEFQRTHEFPTIIKLRVISQQQQLLRLDFEEYYSPKVAEGVFSCTKENLSHIHGVILSDYGKGGVGEPKALIDLVRASNIPIYVDPKGSDFSIYRGATILKPNRLEFEAVVGVCNSEQIFRERGLNLAQSLSLEALLVTRGDQGMTLMRPGKPILHIPTQAREVFDVSGAGDTVIAVLAAALGSGVALEESVKLANIAAGVVVSKQGAVPISAPELLRASGMQGQKDHSILSEEQLIDELKKSRLNGEKIVMTNGCFDIIHAGHVGYLQEARKLGDRLVVAVNSDQSVKRLKGEGRPVNPVSRRMRVLAGLESVDWVVSFEDDTAKRLVRQLKPEVMVKGGDYLLDEVVEKEEVESYGGKVVVLGFEDDCSTTAIMEKIREKK